MIAFDDNGKVKLAAGPDNQAIIDALPNGTTHIEVVENDVPDRYFYEAFAIVSDTLVIDDSKARDLIKSEWRKIREPLFKKLDIAYMIADEAGDTTEKSNIADKKNDLRDVTALPQVSSLSLTDLKAFEPPIFATVEAM